MVLPYTLPSWRAPSCVTTGRICDEELLDVRMSDLPLAIEGTLADRIAQLRGELDARDLRFPLHFYLSDEWFTPDGATAIAIPFYLAHPRLEKLEEAQMLEVEGGEYEWCMRILRHEAGHAIDNAFRLRRRRQRQHTFGSPSKPYPEFYTPKPTARASSCISILDAQSHPDEDFAETFAVWLTPNSEWRQRYAGWRALGKLEYMDSLMDRCAAAPPFRIPTKSIRWRTPNDAAPALSQQAPLLRRGLPELLRSRSAAPVLRRRRVRRRDHRRAVHQSHPALGQTRRLGLDRHLPVHDRSGARRHDRGAAAS